MANLDTLTVIVNKENDRFIALCVELNIATEGTTQEDTLTNMEEAVLGYIEYAIMTDRVEQLIPRPAPEYIIKQYKKGSSKLSQKKCPLIKSIPFDIFKQAASPLYV